MSSGRRFVLHAGPTLMALDFACLVAGQSVVLGQNYARLGLSGPVDAAAVFCLALLACMGFLYATGCFRRDVLVDPIKAASRLPVAIGFSGGVLFLLLHYVMWMLFPDAPAYRSVSRCFTIASVSSAVSICAGIASRTVFRLMARRHLFRRRILVVGTGLRALHLQSLMTRDVHRPVAELLYVTETVLDTFPTSSRNALPEELLSSIVPADGRPLDVLARELDVDEVVVAADDRRGLSIEALLTCKSGGIAVTDYQSFIERETQRVDLRWVEQSWLVYSDGFQIGMLDNVLKRVLDIVVSLTCMVVSLPILLVAVVLIRSEGPGRIFFVQERVTLGSRSFSVYKLRTMRPDSEKGGPSWTGYKDPRITRVGSFLRRTRIDEIPQFMNVLLGDMSLVGPRPERPVFIEQLSRKVPLYNLRHTVKAGLTGWAQVNYPYGASIEDAKAKLEYDLYYIKNYRIVLDILIILQTIRVLIWPDGVR